MSSGAPTTCPLCGSADHERTQMTAPSSAPRAATLLVCRGCGEYQLTHAGEVRVRGIGASDRLLLAGHVVRSNDLGEVPLIDYGTVDELIRRGWPRSNPLRQMDELLLLIAAKVNSVDAWAEVDVARDFLRLRCRTPSELGELLNLMLNRREWIEPRRDHARPLAYRPTIKGWERVQELQLTKPRGDKAFVAMSFAPELVEIYDSAIEPALSRAGYVPPFRVDRVEHDGKIDDAIMAAIRRCSLVVADFTGQRGGVYYEAGFAIGLGIPVIHTCRRDDLSNLHFDTRQYNYIVWESADELRGRLSARVQARYMPRT